MSVERLEKFEVSKIAKSLCGLVLHEGEKGRLYDICVKYNIPITYPDLFLDDTHYYLWGIRKTGIGLIGTIIMNYLEENNGTVFYSLNELEKYLEKED